MGVGGVSQQEIQENQITLFFLNTPCEMLP